MTDSFNKKINMLFALGQLRNWHPNYLHRNSCGEYYMTGNGEVDGKEITINIEAICKHRGIPLNPYHKRCDQLFEVLEKNLIYNDFKDTYIKFCDSNFNLLLKYQIGI